MDSKKIPPESPGQGSDFSGSEISTRNAGKNFRPDEKVLGSAFDPTRKFREKNRPDLVKFCKNPIPGLGPIHFIKLFDIKLLLKMA
jgi:hypothetical protein